MNDRASADRPIPEYLLRKPTSGAHDSAIIHMLGIKRSSLLEPVVSGTPSMKDIIAALGQVGFNSRHKFSGEGCGRGEENNMRPDGDVWEGGKRHITT